MEDQPPQPTEAARLHPVPLAHIHKFTPVEQQLFNKFETTDECSAYIAYVARYRGAGFRKTTGNIFIKRWLGQTATLPVDPAQKRQWIQDEADKRIQNNNIPPYHGPRDMYWGPLRQQAARAQPPAGGSGPVQQPLANPQPIAGGPDYFQQPLASAQPIHSGQSSIQQPQSNIQFSTSTQHSAGRQYPGQQLQADEQFPAGIQPPFRGQASYTYNDSSQQAQSGAQPHVGGQPLHDHQGRVQRHPSDVQFQASTQNSPGYRDLSSQLPAGYQSARPQAPVGHPTSGSRPPLDQYVPVQRHPTILDHNSDPNPANLPEDSINLFLDDSAVSVTPPPDFPNHPNQGIHWRYVKTIYKHIEEGTTMTTVRAYIGEDRNGVMRERQIVKNIEWKWGTVEQGVPQTLNPEHKAVKNRDELLERYKNLMKTESEYILRPTTKRTSQRVALRDENGQPWLSEGNEIPMEDVYCGVRFYSEDCHAGDLERLISQHNEENGEIPSAFIWLVVRAVSEALHNIQTGELFPSNDSDDPFPKARSGWTPILHQDIKPANIFLRPSPYGGYPIPVLADFDSSISIPSKDAKSTGAGTEGYISPENVLATRRDNPDKDFHISFSSDVWGLGNVIWDMIHSTWEGNTRNLIHQWQQTIFGNPDYDEIHVNHLSTIAYASERYWETSGAPAPELPSPTGLKLESIETRCGQYTKTERPTAALIAREANDYLTSVEHVFGLDAATIGPQLRHGRIMTKKDSFIKGRVHNIRRTHKTAKK